MKRGFLGIFESAYLAGAAAGVEIALEEKGYNIVEKLIPLDKMVYVAAFQGGIDEFITMTGSKEDEPLPDFIVNRFRQPNKSSLNLIPEIINVFKHYISKDKDSRIIMMTISFLFDLIMAMKNDASVINVSGVPSIDEVKTNLPPEISFPIINIISQLKSTKELLPAPSLYIPKESIERLSVILESDIYSLYSIAHKNLEDATQDNNKVIEDVKMKGLALLNKGKDVLLRKRVSLDVIPVIPKIVDAVFGKLPGVLAQIAGDSASRLLEDKKNIVIYQFDEWLRDYVKFKKYHLLRRPSTS